MYPGVTVGKENDASAVWTTGAFEVIFVVSGNSIWATCLLLMCFLCSNIITNHHNEFIWLSFFR